MFHRHGTYCFAETYGWLDVALQVLTHLGWGPECSGAQTHNIERKLPPPNMSPRFHPGKRPPWHREAWGTNASEGPRDTRRTIAVYTGASVVRRVATTTCVIRVNNVSVYRSLYVHGRSLGADTPQYLDEAAVIHSLRALHDWLADSPLPQETVRGIEMYAGNFQTIGTIQGWLAGRGLTLKTVAASAVMDDLARLDSWLACELYLTAWNPPEGVETLTDLPWRYREVLEVTEDFRRLAIHKLGDGWIQGLPRVPVGKEELKDMLKKQQKADETDILRMLATMESESAEIITRLSLTREVVAAALAVLQSDHAAQVNLLSILGGTRFKYAIHGVLVPTRCPNKRYGRQCDQEDSYEHLLRCYALSTEERPGVAAVDFLVTMAKRTKTRQPGVPTPMYGI